MSFLCGSLELSKGIKPLRIMVRRADISYRQSHRK